MHDTLHKLHCDTNVGLPYLATTLCYKTHLPFLFFSLVYFVGGTTYPWVVPIGTSHPKLLKPIQLYNNIGLI